MALALELDVPVAVIASGLLEYAGVDRRFQRRGEARGVTVVDDYGHHPTEVRATLAAARLCRFGRIHVIFQPHRYTRTQHLLDEFARSFHQADAVYLMDIYAASEPPIAGVSSEVLVERLQDFGHRGARYCGSMESAVAAVVEAAAPGDVIVTMGAGSVWQAGEKILARLREQEAGHGTQAEQ